MRRADCCAAHRTDIVNLPTENGQRTHKLFHIDVVLQFLFSLNLFSSISTAANEIFARIHVPREYP